MQAGNFFLLSQDLLWKEILARFYGFVFLVFGMPIVALVVMVYYDGHIKRAHLTLAMLVMTVVNGV